MKYLIADIFLSALFVVVLWLGFFGYVNYLFTAAMLLVLLAITLPYKTGMAEEPTSARFEEKYKKRQESARRSATASRMIARVDCMISLVRSLRISIRNFFYVSE